MSDYWIRRAQEDEEKAQALAASYSKRQEKAYRNAYKAIEGEVNSLYAEILSQPYGQENITRSQLWRYKKYTDLQNQIAKEIGEVGRVQNNIVDMCIEDVFERTMDSKLEDFDSRYTTISKDQMKQSLNTNWAGENYSSRIWKNTNNLADRLKRDISDMICLGKNPEEIKGQLMDDFNISYRVSDRLIRTEANHAFNTAAIESYKAAGVQEVEFIAENDCCDQCEEYRGKTFPVGSVPMLPIHPNCRCCYAPVVELTF